LLSFSVHYLINRRHTQDLQVHELKELLHQITDLSDSLRHLSHCLHPHLLRHFGICAALKVLCEEFAKSSGIQIHVSTPEEFPGLSEDAGLCLFRVSQECLHNIAKHSDADSATVVLERTSGEIRLNVTDTGRGFAQSAAWEKGGLGLTSMRERVLCVGGQLQVQSAPGDGTQVRVTIPVPPLPGKKF
jgi:two-component system sensor histidine kinase UhpB